MFLDVANEYCSTTYTQWVFKERLHYEVFEIKHIVLNGQVKLTDFTLFWGTFLTQIIIKGFSSFSYSNNDECYFVISHRTNLLNRSDNDSSERDYFCDKSARYLQPEVTINTTLSIVSNMRQGGHLSVCSFLVYCKCLTSSYILWNFKSKGH